MMMVRTNICYRDEKERKVAFVLSSIGHQSTRLSAENRVRLSVFCAET